MTREEAELLFAPYDILKRHIITGLISEWKESAIWHLAPSRYKNMSDDTLVHVNYDDFKAEAIEEMTRESDDESR